MRSPSRGCFGSAADRRAGERSDEVVETFLKVMVQVTSSPAKTQDSLKLTETRIGVVEEGIAEMGELRARELYRS